MTEKPAIEGGKPVRKEPLIFGRPFIGEEEIDQAVETLKSGWIGQGPKTKEFEESFANFVGTEHAVALSSCTAGLELSLIALGTKQGDEIITSPISFASTANIVVHRQAKPVFVDVDRETFNIDPESIRKNIGKKTKGIIPIHASGQPCEIEEIVSIAREKNLFVVEDAAHAIGAEYNGKKIGSFGDITCFSFAHNKIITTIEGGMITTDNRELAEHIRINRQHGLSSDSWDRHRSKKAVFGEIIMPGYKAYMTDVQASIGLSQLKKIKSILEEREKIAEKYDRVFENRDCISLQKIIPKARSSHQFYPIILKLEKLKIGRDDFVSALRAENIFAGISFTALHLHEYYRKTFGYRRGMFPNAEYLSDSTVSLPLNNGMGKDDIEDAVLAVEKIINYYKK